MCKCIEGINIPYFGSLSPACLVPYWASIDQKYNFINFSNIHLNNFSKSPKAAHWRISAQMVCFHQNNQAL